MADADRRLPPPLQYNKGGTMTPDERLREAIAAEQLTPAEKWRTVTETARELAQAIRDGNLDECQRAATYIADVTRYLSRS